VNQVAPERRPRETVSERAGRPSGGGFGRAAGVLCLGIVLCAVAGAFAAGSLWVSGLALVLLAVAAPVWVSVAWQGSLVRRRLDRQVVQEGEPVTVTIELHRGALPLPLPGGTLVPWPGGEPMAPPRAGGLVERELTLAGRGRHVLGPACLRVTDPLALCELRRCSAPLEVLVLPRVEPVNHMALRGAGLLEGRGRTSAAPPAALELDTLRAHRPGTPASRIHWPAVARTGVLLERRFVDDDDRRPLVVVDTTNPQSSQDLDSALRAAASLCVHLARQGGVSVLLGEDRRPTRLGPDLRGWTQLHTRLALLPAGAAPASVRGRSPGALLWVSAAAGVPAALKRATRERYLVSPIGADQANGGAALVAGCGVRPLGRGARRAA